MSQAMVEAVDVRHVHPWLRKTHVAVVPGPPSALVDAALQGLTHAFSDLGHEVQPTVDGRTDVLLTNAVFGEPVPWRQAMLFSARRRFGLKHSPTIFTLIPATPSQLADQLSMLERALGRTPLDLADFAFPGLAADAHRVLIEQGLRGGPMMALIRLLQSQSMSIRIILLVGQGQPDTAYFLDLVGAFPRSQRIDDRVFYEDMALRMVTAVSTREVTDHQSAGAPIPSSIWRGLSAPAAMINAGQQLGERRFFTDMVRVADLVQVPALAEVVANQYSEGCFATWDADLSALIATVTGSARPVDKGNIREDDLAVILDVRMDQQGAVVSHVEGKRNDPPSSEAVEMRGMDASLPWIELKMPSGRPRRVPVVRSKLHGHRGIAGFNPARVEYVPMDAAYQHYLVSCGTEAQAHGIVQAFSRAEALRHPADPRQIVFSILPGHGVVLAEKWEAGKAPFQAIWEAMDAGDLLVANAIPQGPLEYVPDRGKRRILRTA